MSNRPSLEEIFQRIVEVVIADFSDIMVDTQLRLTPSGAVERLRIFLVDNTFIDIWLSLSRKYSYHWEQRHVRGCIHRHDNAPHTKWKDVETFPKHFHDGNENNVKESLIPDEPVAAVGYFLSFVRSSIRSKEEIKKLQPILDKISTQDVVKSIRKNRDNR
jgi:hypothetical protein